MFSISIQIKSQKLLVTAVLFLTVLLSTTHAYSISNKDNRLLQKSAEKTTTKPPYLFNSRETHSEESSEDVWYYTDDDYSEEEACPSDQFWHIRGKRCVPFTCPRANWLRDWKTGECLYDTGAEGVSQLKSFGGGRTAFKTRDVLRPRKNHMSIARGRSGGSRMNYGGGKKRLQVDDDPNNPPRYY